MPSGPNLTCDTPAIREDYRKIEEKSINLRYKEVLDLWSENCEVSGISFHFSVSASIALHGIAVQSVVLKLLSTSA